MNDTERAMADRTRSKTYDVLAVSSTVHKANPAKRGIDDPLVEKA